MRSITVHLKGGLGNQLFQFARGYCLAEKYNANLCLDVSFFENDARHGGFMLNDFNIPRNIEIMRLENFTKLMLMINRKININNLFNLGILTDGDKISESMRSVILDGYFQNEDLVACCRDDLLGIIKPKYIVDIDDIEKRIRQLNSVSIHIRRGDYLSKDNKHIFCSLDMNYYKSAIKYICAQCTNTRFFIFSNDMEWAKYNFGDMTNIEYVNNHPPVTDLYLMSLCKHNIIANSTFSWWGSWLNNNIDKKMIAPAAWFINHGNNIKNQANLLKGYVLL